MISCLSGLPGSGKNVYATYLAKKHFQRENNLIKRLIRRLKHEELYINNVYSNYPILLNKRNKIYSNLVSINDLNGSYKFLDNAIIFIDEVQADYDSEEHKIFPKKIATFNQFHRHFGIKDIYYISQHPARIVKKLRDISCRFIKIRRFLVIPFIKIAFLYYSNYYEFDDYGKWHHPTKEMKNYDVDNHFKLFFVNKVFKAYDSTYLSALNKDKPLLNKGTFQSLSVKKEQLYQVFSRLDI